MVVDKKSNNKSKPHSVESNHDRFVRLASSRLSVIKDKLHVLSNLSNRRHYEFSRAEVDKLFADIEDEVQRTRAKFKC